MSAHLILFVKNPTPGAVKTRLQTRYTPEQAAELYRGFTLDTLEKALTVRADRRILAYDPPEAGSDIRRLAGFDWDLRPQKGTDLGARMFEAALESFIDGASRVILTGTDVPSLPADHIRQAFRLLAHQDVVLGPSTDGGYYLIGLSHPIRALFAGIDWSTSKVFAQTLERLATGGHSLGLVPPWYDVDTPEDLDFLLAHARALEQAGQTLFLRHTRACLASLA